MDTLVRLCKPVLWFRTYLKRKRQKEENERLEILQRITRPTHEMLSKREFFKLWPQNTLRKLAGATPLRLDPPPLPHA